MKKITELTAELAAPAIAEQGCTLWDVEYVKEAGTWYLRILLDKEGGVDILDCEEISRKVSDLLDEVDPIEGSYTLEVAAGRTAAEYVWAYPPGVPLLAPGERITPAFLAAADALEAAGTRLHHTRARLPGSVETLAEE